MLGFLSSGFGKYSIVSVLQFSETRVASGIRVRYFTLQVGNLGFPRGQGFAKLNLLCLYFRKCRSLLALQLIYLVLILLSLLQHLHLHRLEFVRLIL